MGFVVEDQGSLDDHIKKVLADAWAENMDVMAAANIIRRALVIFRKDSDQRPTAILPDVPLATSEPIYMLLDETSPGFEHYELMLPDEMPPPEELVEGNQSLLSPTQMAFCKSLWHDNPMMTWLEVGNQLAMKFHLKLSVMSLRRLHARLGHTTERRLTADELHADFYGWCIAALELEPDLTVWRMRERLRMHHHVITSDGVFQRFYDNCKSFAHVTLMHLRDSYKQIGLDLLKEDPALTTNGLLKYLQQNHQITTNQNAIRDFYQELKQGSLPMSKELSLYIDEMDDKCLKKISKKQDWHGDWKKLKKKITCLKEWTVELAKLLSNCKPHPDA